MKILITGFEPFGESRINPSQMLVQSLSEKGHSQAELVTAVLPVDQARAPEQLKALISTHQPDAILAFGLAAGRTKISLERVGLNLQDFRIPDNRGVTLSDQPIDPTGPAAYFSTLPLRAMLTALLKAGIPAELSLSAGAYLCNLVLYTTLHTLASAAPIIPAGFIHLPALPEQAAEMDKPVPSMHFQTMLDAARILIQELASSAGEYPR